MLEKELVLPHLLADLAVRRPEQNALLDVTGPTRTYAGFHETALRWADAYSRVGLGRGDTIVTMLPNSEVAYHAWLGASWLGAIEVPANNMYLGDMLRYLINDSRAATVLMAERFLERLAGVISDLPGLQRVIVPDSSGDLPDLPIDVVSGADFLDGAEPREFEGPTYRDVAAIIYTSGTTGPSKGVLVPWGELHWFALATPDDFLAPGEALYSPYPAFHISGKVTINQTTLAEGALVIRESFSPASFWDDIRANDVKSLALLGPMAAMLMGLPEREDDADNPAEDFAMGATIPELEEFRQRFGLRRYYTGFGMTEIGVALTSGWDPPDYRTCGRPRPGRPGYEVRVVDENDEPVEPGTVGELIVRTDEPWVMNLGYWGMPDKTAEAWRNGWFHTGDGFIVDGDGWYYFVDRLKDAIRRRGENISSFEVESGVNQHPAVQESAAIGVPSELGEDEVMVLVIVNEGHTFDHAEFIGFLAERMPRFMIPRYVEVVTEIPKTQATFRTQKVKLRDRGVTEATWDREAAGVAL